MLHFPVGEYMAGEGREEEEEEEAKEAAVVST